MLKRKVEKVRQVENSGIKADVLWATALMEHCPGERRERENQVKVSQREKSEDDKDQKANEWERWMAWGQVLTGGRRSPVLARPWGGRPVLTLQPPAALPGPWCLCPTGPGANPTS